MDLVVSSYATALIAPAMPVVMSHGFAFVSLLGSATNDAFHYDRTVNISPTGGHMQEDFAKGYFKIAMTAEPRPKTVAIAGLDSDFLQRSMQSARKQAKEPGIEIVYDKSYPPGTVDYGPIVRAIQAAKPDIVYFASYPPDLVGLLKAVNEAKLTATLLGGGMIGPQITAIKAQFGPLLNNLVCWDSYAPEPTMKFPGVDAFLERYRAAAQKEKVDPLGLYAPPLAYAQMQVLATAVSRVGKIDHAAIGADFHANTFSTVVGDLKFDAEWRVGAGTQHLCAIPGRDRPRHRAVQKGRHAGHSLPREIQVRETPHAVSGVKLKRKDGAWFTEENAHFDARCMTDKNAPVLRRPGHIRRDGRCFSAAAVGRLIGCPLNDPAPNEFRSDPNR